MDTGIKKAFDNFMASDDLKTGIISSTKDLAYGYAVELFPEGAYRVFWNKDSSSLYQSPGLIVRIPRLTDDEYDEDDPEESFFENAIEELQIAFDEIESY